VLHSKNAARDGSSGSDSAVRFGRAARQLYPNELTFPVTIIFARVGNNGHGHVSCTFLALVLKKELEERIADLGRNGS
jgi:hypothetical protein